MEEQSPHDGTELLVGLRIEVRAAGCVVRAVGFVAVGMLHHLAVADGQIVVLLVNHPNAANSHAAQDALLRWVYRAAE